MQGLILINKPIGFTSQDVVSKLKKVLNIKKAGHTGTLDPLATGVLPILIGDYTKLSKYLIEHDKTYIAKLKLGEKTDTGDAEGNVVENKEIPNNISIELIANVLNEFKGNITQTPPMYSAIKVNGKKLYEYAREGKTVEIPKREITIYDISLINYNDQTHEIEFKVSCSKGTYIRVLCEDIALKLNTVGYMSALQRTLVDKFKIEDSVTFEDLEKIKENDLLIQSKLIKMEDIFNNLNTIELNKRKTELFLNGVMLTMNYEDGLYNIKDFNNDYLGTGIIKNELLKRDIIVLKK